MSTNEGRVVEEAQCIHGKWDPELDKRWSATPSDPHLPFRASTWFPELEIRHQAHQEASGTHKWKGMAAANVTQQLRACLGSLQAPRGPSAQVSGALSNNKRSAI